MISTLNSRNAVMRITAAWQPVDDNSPIPRQIDFAKDLMTKTPAAVMVPDEF
jgi:hypothetical protein